MSYSCVDAWDSVLESLIGAGLVKADDIRAVEDDPHGQALIALPALDRAITERAKLHPGWAVSSSSDGQYLYVRREGKPGEVHIKAESEGIVIDVWSDGSPGQVEDSATVFWNDLEEQP